MFIVNCSGVMLYYKFIKYKTIKGRRCLIYLENLNGSKGVGRITQFLGVYNMNYFLFLLTIAVFISCKYTIVVVCN